MSYNKEFTTTIVSAYIPNINKDTRRTVSDYIQYGKLLINIPNPKVIFIDCESYNAFFKSDDLNDKFINTTFIKINKERRIEDQYIIPQYIRIYIVKLY